MKKWHCFLSMMCVVCCIGAAEQAVEEIAAEPAVYEFVLRPVEDGFKQDIPYTGRNAEVSFTKEPEYAGKTVYRHPLQFGGGVLSFIGMAYDVDANLLYVDQNRNLDLTDDGPGFPGDASGAWMGEFSDVVLNLTHGDIPVRYVLDISIFGQFYLSATIKSGWQADVEVADVSGVLGVADNLDGVFDGLDSLRFDHERHREARLSFGRSEGVSLPRWIHLEGKNYALDFKFRVQDEETVLAATWTPITDDLMTISFEGQHVSRLVLNNLAEEYGLLEWPVPEMQIPKGRYTLYQVDLLDSYTGHPRGTNRLEPGGNTLLKTGGPVKQEVSVSRSGAYLSMDYALRGVDNTRYSANREPEPPGFAVYSGERKVGSGQFEYG